MIGPQQEKPVFEEILNWKLLGGSHEFPGPDGGTCIMEAAIVAAGFAYRAVESEADCPPCFSPVLARAAISLNDQMPDDTRQELLMPFVTRLVGTADSREKEIERAEFITVQIVKRVLSLLFRVIGPRACARACEAVHDSASAEAAAQHAADQALDRQRKLAAVYGPGPAAIMDAHGAVCRAAGAVASAAQLPPVAADEAMLTAGRCAVAVPIPAVRDEIYRAAIAILDEAIRLGRHAAALDTAVVVSRMENLKQRVLTPLA
ncbi:MAG: hypothetical protein WB760_28400 [Xanthobacteraceae bacterium]